MSFDGNYEYSDDDLFCPHPSTPPSAPIKSLNLVLIRRVNHPQEEQEDHQEELENQLIRRQRIQEKQTNQLEE